MHHSSKTNEESFYETVSPDQVLGYSINSAMTTVLELHAYCFGCSDLSTVSQDYHLPINDQRSTHDNASASTEFNAPGYVFIDFIFPWKWLHVKGTRIIRVDHKLRYFTE